MYKQNEWLTTKEAANHLRISPRTLNNARSTGTGIVINFCKIGSRIFYKKSDIDTYVENNTYIHTGKKLSQDKEVKS
jgi:hypothetical protein